jgi:histidine ammonia-lyase
VIELDGRSLTAADIVAAAHRRDDVTLTAAGRDRIVSAFERAQRLTAERPVYGRSTGVGANRSVTVHDLETHSRSLLRSHATSAGPLRAPERVRAMLVVRLNQLAAGGSGASPELADSLLALIEADALPPVREHGGVGTGDLAALATTALALMGEVPTSPPIDRPARLGPHDALPLLSSNAAAIGDAALACTDLHVLARAYVVVAALTFTAINGNAEAFAESIASATPFPGAERTTAWMRALVDQAALPARIQDPVSLRAVPQAHGHFVDSVDRLDDVVRRYANAAGENPLIVGAAGEQDAVVHHGGFHAVYLAAALGDVAGAAVRTAKLALSRIGLLNEPAFTGLHPFLAGSAPGASGAMMLQYVAASALGDLLLAATPAGLHVSFLSRGVEDDASFASLAARQAQQAADHLQVVIACEAVAAARALQAGRRTALTDQLRRAVELLPGSPSGLVDRDLTGEVAAYCDRLSALAGLLASDSSAARSRTAARGGDQ